jgi:chromosome segregation ATPase
LLLKKASEYREHAAQCQKLAAGTQNPEHKAMLMKMAETWETLAADREEHIARQGRIAALEQLPPSTAK